MYYRYFGLDEEPFSIAVNPRYLFMSARHRDALAHLLYGVGVGGGFILLTGEVGTGKTTVNRCLLEQIPDNTDLAIILNPALNAVELLATVCDELGIDYQPGEQSLKVLTDKLHQFLLKNYADGRNTVLLIDEAQHLQFDVLEQIRLLTNLETHTKKLLQIILVGQPELRELLNRPELRQLAQRITARYQLKPLNLEETDAYIRHRLQVAGLPAGHSPFPKEVVKDIHKISRGVPRLINVLCDRALLGSYGQNKTTVDKSLLKQAVVEVMGEEDIPVAQTSLNGPLLALCLLLVLLSGFFGWQWWSQNQSLSQLAASEAAPPAAALDTSAGNAQVASPATSQPAVYAPRYLWLSEAEALSQLLLSLGYIGFEPNELCQTNRRGNAVIRLRKAALHCERLQLASWQDLIALNRPAVLKLISRAKIRDYISLVGIEDDHALLSASGAGTDQQLTRIPLRQLGESWTGEAILIWRPPAAYQRPVGSSETGPMVSWLAKSFALLDGQDRLLASNRVTPGLSQRIKIFQRKYQLEDDGVAGVNTLLKLNEELGVAMTLIKPDAADNPLTGNAAAEAETAREGEG